MTLKEMYQAELRMRQEAYVIALRSAADLVHDARQREDRPSTHVGHNLASRAIEIAEAAVRVEAAETALRTIDQLEQQ